MIENSQPDGGYVLCFGGKRIPFRIEYRKRKKLAITVHPDCGWRSSLQKDVPSSRCFQRVEKRAGWILRQWRYFEQFQPKHPGPRYVSGETHLYLGRQYRLKVHQGIAGGGEARRQIPARLDEGSQTMRPNQSLLERWYRDHAERVFSSSIASVSGAVPFLRLLARAST